MLYICESLLLSILLSLAVDVGSVKLTLDKTQNGPYCGRLQCLADETNLPDSVLLVVGMTVYGVANTNIPQKLASISTFTPGVIVEATKTEVINATGSISKSQASLDLRLLSEADCGYQSYQCELDFVNTNSQSDVIRETITPADDNALAAACNVDGVYNTRSCYRFVNELLSFYEALAICTAAGGYIVQIESSSEQEWVVQQLQTRGFNASWLGATDQFREGSWRWISNGEAIGPFTYWESGQPDNYMTGQNCLYISNTRGYKWDDFGCLLQRLNVVCETRCETILRQDPEWSLLWKTQMPCRQTNLPDRVLLVVGMTVYGVANTNIPQKLASISTFTPGVIVEATKTEVINATGSISKSQASLDLRLLSEADCGYQSYQCELDFVNTNSQSDVIRETITPADDNALAAACTVDGVYNMGSCYRFVNELLSFYDALALCTAAGGHLLQIESSSEQEWVALQLQARLFNDTWLGATDQFREGSWRWISNGEAIGPFTNWYLGEPNNNLNAQNCVCIKVFMGYKWDDLQCINRTLSVVCETTLSR